MNKHTKAKGMLIASMILWGTLGPFTRQIAVSSDELALYRAVLALGFIGGYLVLKKQAPLPSACKRERWLLLLSGMALGINWVLLFEAYRHTTIATATLCYYSAPLLVTAASALLFREKLTGKQLLCFVMSTVGLLLIIGIGDTDGNAVGIMYGLGAAVFYSTVVLINKAFPSANGLQRTFVQLLGAVAVLTPYVVGTGGVSLGALDTTGWICLLIVGLLHTGVAYCAYFSSLRHLDGQRVAMFSYIDPVTAILISATVLGEPLRVPQLVGGLLILGFTLYNEKQ